MRGKRRGSAGGCGPVATPRSRGRWSSNQSVLPSDKFNRKLLFSGKFADGVERKARTSFQHRQPDEVFQLKEGKLTTAFAVWMMDRTIAVG